MSKLIRDSVDMATLLGLLLAVSVAHLTQWKLACERASLCDFGEKFVPEPGAISNRPTDEEKRARDFSSRKIFPEFAQVSLEAYSWFQKISPVISATVSEGLVTKLNLLVL